MTPIWPQRFDRGTVEKAWRALLPGQALAYWAEGVPDYGRDRQPIMALARSWGAKLHVIRDSGRTLHVAVKTTGAAA